MKQFVFSLQSLHDMQAGIEKQQKIKLKMIEKKQFKQRDELESLNDEFDNVKEEYCQVISTGVLASRVAKYDLFFSRLKAGMSAVQSKIRKLDAAKGQCLQQLVNTRKEIKMLEKIREREYKIYLKVLKKEQSRLIEDFISYKAIVS